MFLHFLSLGNIMMLSYSLGLTGGSAVAYLLDSWLGPMVDPCAPLNLSTPIQPIYNHTKETINITTILETTLMPSTTSVLSTAQSTTIMSTTASTLLSTISSGVDVLSNTLAAGVSSVSGIALNNITSSSILQAVYESSTEGL